MVIQELIESKQIYRFEDKINCIVIYEKILKKVMAKQDYYYVEISAEPEEYIKILKNSAAGSLIILCKYKIGEV